MTNPSKKLPPKGGPPNDTGVGPSVANTGYDLTRFAPPNKIEREPMPALCDRHFVWYAENGWR